MFLTTPPIDKFIITDLVEASGLKDVIKEKKKNYFHLHLYWLPQSYKWDLTPEPKEIDIPIRDKGKSPIIISEDENDALPTLAELLNPAEGSSAPVERSSTSKRLRSLSHDAQAETKAVETSKGEGTTTRSKAKAMKVVK